MTPVRERDPFLLFYFVQVYDVCVGIRAGREDDYGGGEVVSVLLLHLKRIVLDAHLVPADRLHGCGVIERLELELGLEDVEVLLLEPRDRLEYCSKDWIVAVDSIVVLDSRVFVEAPDLPVLWEG